MSAADEDLKAIAADLDLADLADLCDPPPTDVGNAERFVAEHAHDSRYVPGQGWLFYDGRRWVLDRDGEVTRRAKATTRRLLQAASGLADETARKRLVIWALTSEAEPRIRAAIALASTDSTIVAHPEQLDADPDALNVENGTVDLRTGDLRPHRCEDLLTKLAPVTYDRAARSPRFERFLLDATKHDCALAEYLQRFAGYALTGHTVEQILAFLHGPGATGKTTFIEVARACMGDYAATTEFDTFLAGRGRASQDLARFPGVRLVVASEVAANQRFDTPVLKGVTGGDKITARHLYREPFEYHPQFKLFLIGNDRPAIDAHDEATWRRVRAIPFVHVVPDAEQDRDLKRKLTEDPTERAAVLAWMVEGCLTWRECGLQAPDIVTRYTAGYRRENDHLADWLSACCDLDPATSAPGGRLRSSYEQWCSASGEEAITPREFAAALRARGLAHKRTKRARIWTGVDLKGDAVTHGDATNHEVPHVRVHGEVSETGVTRRHPSPIEAAA